MVCAMTKKESEIHQCALMILNDQCPPDREHYLCMMGEDESLDCIRCWGDYMQGVAAGKIEFPKMGRGAHT